jgi:uncharacterized protein (TIGR03067 family)
MKQSLEHRERMADEIIDRRVEELLDASLSWEPTGIWVGSEMGNGTNSPSKPTPAQVLSLSPMQPHVDVDQPAPGERDQCIVEIDRTENFPGWVLKTASGRILRRFMDSNGDGIVDQWRYYKEGVEIYRDIDSDNDGKADSNPWIRTHFAWPPFNNDNTGSEVTKESELDGTWEVERTIDNGKENLVAKDYQYYRWRFDTKARTVSTEWKKLSGESHTGENKFTLDQTTTPLHLTTYGDGILLQAIYEIKGDRLRVAMLGRPEVERPNAFDSTSRNNAGPLVIFEFKRAKVAESSSTVTPITPTTNFNSIGTINETATLQTTLPGMFRQLELHLAFPGTGKDRTEHTAPGGENIFVDKQAFTRILDGVVARVIGDGPDEAAIEVSFGPESSKWMESLVLQHLNKPVAVFVGGTLRIAPTVHRQSGNVRLITHQLPRRQAEQIAQEFNHLVKPVNAVAALKVSDVDTEPVWGEAVDGLQLGVSGIRQDRHFKAGETIRFRLSVRNVGTESLRFGYKLPESFWWTKPLVETAAGEQVLVQQVAVRFVIHLKDFTATLEPNGVVSVPVIGIVALGESATAHKDWPRIAKPELGEYRLNGMHEFQRIDDQGKQIGQATKLSSGKVAFHIDQES